MEGFTAKFTKITEAQGVLTGSYLGFVILNLNEGNSTAYDWFDSKVMADKIGRFRITVEFMPEEVVPKPVNKGGRPRKVVIAP